MINYVELSLSIILVIFILFFITPLLFKIFNRELKYPIHIKDMSDSQRNERYRESLHFSLLLLIGGFLLALIRAVESWELGLIAAATTFLTTVMYTILIVVVGFYFEKSTYLDRDKTL